MKNIRFVAPSALCTGCGACAGVCPTGAISMTWDDYGDRVACVDESKCTECGLCLRICPGHELDYQQINEVSPRQENSQLLVGIGSHQRCEIIYATDGESFRQATSGGIVRTLVADLLERGEIDGALMITGNEELSFPFFAPAKIFTDPDEIRTHEIHSRYCPAPLLENLNQLEAGKRYAVVTLPCHTHAIRKLQRHDPAWKERIPYLFGLICSGTPTASANAYLFADNGVDPDTLVWLDYRYGEWPKGVFGRDRQGKLHNVRKMGGLKEQNRLFQMIGVVYMSPYFWRRRCLFCADFFNQYADIACGDPWVKRYWKGSIKDGIKGGTLCIVRTPEIAEQIERLKAEGKIATRMELTAQDIDGSMGLFQHKRIKYFAGYSRAVSRFGLKFPVHRNFVNPYGKALTLTARINLLKSNLSKKRKRWPVFKYIQFVEEGFAFLRRKLL
ncbi:MAG: Coenzyme F420 hydrogenase/dehydrogenase, beta subunit C-terminal domain [Candidatus Cloacimonetes bacterium]|nr:Coenzyme F420 hydrogenase/dehydrogenase, beta subunit C-terminal domain [Candidatus Cloacimonadota bacterium]